MKRIKPTTEVPITLPEIELPAGPFVTRDGQTPVLTEAGLAAITLLASESVTQVAIASRIGITFKVFKGLLGRADDDPPSPARAAWELGLGRLESELGRLLLSSARRGNTIAQIFFSKAKLGWRESSPVQIDASQKHITFLPASMTEEEYFRSLNISGPLDTRPPEIRGATPWTTTGLLPPTPHFTNTPTEPTKGVSDADQSKT